MLLIETFVKDVNKYIGGYEMRIKIERGIHIFPTYQTGTEGRDEPTTDNLANLDPVDSAASEPSKTNTSDGTNNGMGSQDGPSARRSKQNPGERSDQRSYHAQHQKLRLCCKQIDVNQISFDLSAVDDPIKNAPKNSQTVAISTAFLRLRALEPTAAPNELLTSFAPMLLR